MALRSRAFVACGTLRMHCAKRSWIAHHWHCHTYLAELPTSAVERLWPICTSKELHAAFKQDEPALAAAFEEIRSNFAQHKDVTDKAEVDALCAAGHDALDFLRTSVVQAKLNERGNYGASARVCAAAQSRFAAATIRKRSALAMWRFCNMSWCD